MNKRWLEIIQIGNLPQPIQMDLSQWCKDHRSGDPLLTTVEQWTVYEIVRVWLEYHGITSLTHQVLVIMDAIDEGKDNRYT